MQETITIVKIGGQILDHAENLSHFRDQFVALSGKKILVYSDVYSQSGYYMASVADKVYLNPKGAIEIKGLFSNLAFFKNALEKLEVQPEIIRHGKFKSAVEPFMQDHMSESNRLQLRTLQRSVWTIMRKEMADSRHMSEDNLDAICNNFSVRTAEDAKKYNLVDKLLYYDQVLDELKNIASDDNDPAIVSMEKYCSAVKDAQQIGRAHV